MSAAAKDIISSSWAKSTRAKYNGYIRRWSEYCQRHQIEPYSSTTSKGIDFLVHLHHEGAKYDTVAGARSALSAILPVCNGVSFGKNTTVSRILKGMFKIRPRLPKQIVIYDMNRVLKYMVELPQNECLSLGTLTGKLATLLCILSGQRAQTIVNLHINLMEVADEEVVFFNPVILKTTTPSSHQKPLVFQSFPHNNKLCVVGCLGNYIQRVRHIRKHSAGSATNLILSYASPHNPVKSATLARYVTDFLGKCGIDLTVYTAHSTRKASTSKAEKLGLSLKEISGAAGWKSASTFQKHYKLPITNNFGSSLLQDFQSTTL